MSSMSFIQFSAVEYIKKLREANFTEAQAEIVVELIEHHSQIIQDYGSKISHLESRDVANKGDIKESELRLQKEIAIVNSSLQQKIKSLEVKLLTMYGGGFLLLLGVLAKGFHWL